VMACQFLNNSDYVLHTYAAIAIDKILSLRTREKENIDSNTNKKNEPESNGDVTFVYKYPKDNLVRVLDKILPLLFNIFEKYEESQTNEYVMKTILRVVTRAEEGLIKLIDPLLQSMKKILNIVAVSAMKPTFNHCMFEIIAASIQYICCYGNNNQNNQCILQFERALMETFQNTLAKDNCAELHHYIYQIINLMLRIRNNIDNNYEILFDRLLKTELWNQEGNIISISFMFADYLKIMNQTKKNDFIIVDNNRRLTGMLGIFQALLSKRTYDVYAFRVLRAIFEYIPKEIIDKYMKDVLKLVFVRISKQKSIELCSNFIVCLSIFIIKHGFSAFLEHCDNIQKDMFAMILEKIWLEYSRHIKDLVDRKIVTVAMITIMKDKNFWNNNKLNCSFPKMMQNEIEVFEKNPLQSTNENDTEYYLLLLEEQGSGCKFSRLNFVKNVPNDITKSMGDPRLLLVETLIPMFKNDSKLTSALCQCLDKKYITSFNEYCSKFDVRFTLSS